MESAAESEINRIQEEINRNIERIESKISVYPKRSILLIGITGSGKSTLANYLSGEEIQVAEETNLGYIIKGGRFITGDQIESITTIPEYWIYKDIYYWDCPGFNDNRSPVQEITNSYCLKSICGLSKKCKIVLVISQITIYGKEAKNFYDLCQQIKMSLKNLEDISKCLTVVITRCFKLNNSELTNKIEEHRNLKCFPSNLSDFFNTLIDKSINGDICFFPNPRNEGKLVNHIETLYLRK